MTKCLRHSSPYVKFNSKEVFIYFMKLLNTRNFNRHIFAVHDPMLLIPHSEVRCGHQAKKDKLQTSHPEVAEVLICNSGIAGLLFGSAGTPAAAEDSV